MERRQFLTGLLGAAGVAAVAAAWPGSANALGTGPLTDTTPQEGGILPELKAASEETVSEDGVQVAWHRGRPHRGGPPRGRRRRVRRRRFRQVCRRYRNRWGQWVRRCRREPYWGWFWI